MTRVISQLSRTFGILGTGAIVVITVGLAVDVALRTVTGQGIPGMIEAIDPLLVCAAFLGLAMTESKGQHVGMTAIADRLPFRVRYRVIAIGTVLVMALIVWLGAAGAESAFRSFSRGEVRPGIVDIPLWPARVAVVIGCAVLFLQLMLTCRDALRTAKQGTPVGSWTDRDDA